MNKKIKTRFAPSPTGYLHIGGLRTALYSYLYANQHKGEFVLRIEDTDQKREVKGAVEALIATLQKMGLDWDSGPVLDSSLNLGEKGQNGPFLQSKRVDLYQEYADELIGQGKAYYCFCTEERLATLREDQEANKQAPRYDGLCRNLVGDEIEEKLKQGLPRVVRLKIPENRPASAEASAGKEVVVHDLLRGDVHFKTTEIDDQVLIKSDGFPTYHLANVVDDHLMEITHVIRGEEWLPSTPKHILLYEAFDWKAPEFAHLPLLLNADKSKLSKRQGDVAVEDYLAKGYLPEALINYVALLGWHPQDNQEVFSLDQLIKDFSLERVQKAGAVFDLEKLNWFNAYYIKQLSDEELAERCKEFLPNINQEILVKILKIEKERLNNLSELGEKAKMFLELPEYNSEILVFSAKGGSASGRKKSTKETSLVALEKVLEKLNSISEQDWQKEKIKACLTEVVGENSLTNGDVFWPTRVAVSGLEKSPAPEEIMWVLGKEESLSRIKIAVKKLS